MAAVVLLLAASTLWWLRDGEFLGLSKTYQTERGEQRVVQLPDSSELRLNTVKQLRFGRPAANGRSKLPEVKRSLRSREMTSGAFALQLAMPMYSLWEHSLISTLRHDATIVTVVEGSVAVLAGEPPPPTVTGLPLGALRVNAGYQVHVDAGGVSAQPIAVDVQQTVAWLQRKIAFEQGHWRGGGRVQSRRLHPHRDR